ncbi:hypothetical protein M406DRAFT_74093 [Cryphonectria parasitica EP155]|uniref:Uncharacterized protein n=1 Tax=Cryphonectria parasitica (strain ATCC 38755 / EP155) TaxID=660469 RepID=A0A9P4XY74_CRYP1|nr:uncharacterized protein M406DRAFT_74093 [Cryphonectria parasitica EP155]KAF3763479.1 hypothetical protein M406DRAFT_74093 [Cryphonectria parasitica EP155]
MDARTTPKHPVYTAPTTKSWVFKRNYTFAIIDGGNGNFHCHIWDNIVCAVNIFDQDEYHKYPIGGNGKTYNAWCLKNPPQAYYYWPGAYTMAHCMVEFGPDSGMNDKRSVDNWVVKNIT